MSKPETIKTLFDEDLLRIATLPPNNGNGSGAHVTLPLLAENYPAKTATMWNMAYLYFGITAQNTMVIGNPQDAGRILAALKSDPRYQGGGAGVGFKEVVMPCLDSVTPLAQAIGAVNIIKKEKGLLIGDNTDGEGYAASLSKLLEERGGTLKGKSTLILGAGGSARGIGFALATHGAALTILNRTAEKALELALSINNYIGSPVARGGSRDLIAHVLPTQDAVVSVIDDAHSPLDGYSTLGTMSLPITSESIAENRSSTEELLKLAKEDLIVSDIRIRHDVVPMLVQARELGFPILDGIGMVINQGAAAFWWLYGDQLSAAGHTIEKVREIMTQAARDDT